MQYILYLPPTITDHSRSGAPLKIGANLLPHIALNSHVLLQNKAITTLLFLHKNVH
jgi:hypothetical protein